jgi:hypothetical protein
MENMHTYYESIRSVYDKIVNWKPNDTIRRRIWRLLERLLIAFGISLLLTVVPVLPFLLSILLPLFNVTIPVLRVGNISVEPLILYWFALIVFLVLSLLFTNWVRDRINPPQEKPPYSISADQLSFLKVYSAYNELMTYSVDYLDEHVDRATEELGALLTGWAGLPMELIDTGFRFEIGPSLLLPPPRLTDQIEVARGFLRTFERFPWFHLHPDVDAILRALTSFSSRVYTRLRAREDIASVTKVLKHLAEFLYAYLPEFETRLGQEELQHLHDAGNESLSEFVAEINRLTDFEYRPKEEKKAEMTARSRLRNMLYRDNPVTKFLVWFMLMLVVTTATSVMAWWLFHASVDTLVVMIVSTSALAAATLTALPFSTRPR